MRVAIFSTKSYDIEFLNRFNDANKHQLSFFEVSLNIATSKLAKDFDAVCVFVNDTLDAETIKQLASCEIKLIVLRCAGYNNVDIAAATANNIKVVRVPAYSPEAVAEHTVSLILSLNRKTHKAYNRVKESNFSLYGLMGFNLYNKTVGVIGTGKIGTAFCRIMLGFGCKIIAYDIVENKSLQEAGIVFTTLDEVLKNADILSLHCPLTPLTKYVFNDATFKKIKKGAMLINTSRGALINTKDAIENLKSGQLGYLGIDVYEQEENLFFNDLTDTIIQDDLIERLIYFPNVLVTPHQGFFTKEALDEIAITTINNCSDFENGTLLKNEIKSL